MTNDNFSSRKLFICGSPHNKMKPDPERLVLHSGGDQYNAGAVRRVGMNAVPPEPSSGSTYGSECSSPAGQALRSVTIM